MHDAIIIGAGPAGLNAALVLGRCRRSVLVFDSGKPRNAASRALHGYLSREGISPLELRQIGRDELRIYRTVEFCEEAVVSATPLENGFEVSTISGQRAYARQLLLATGRIDAVPDKPGFREFYGHGVYHCPYCDGWENRDQPLVVYGNDQKAVDLALELLTWSANVTVCTDGAFAWDNDTALVLEQSGIRVVERTICALEGENGSLRSVRFEDAGALACAAVFFCSDCSQRSTLPERLGCSFDGDGAVACDGHSATRVPGLYVAGNVRGGLHLAIAAAAEGAEAAVNMNEALLELDLQANRPPAPATFAPRIS
jgi:thioredoxin reductase